VIGRRKTLLLAALASVAFESLALAQDHPLDARGFSPERLYDVHDIDTVNMFSGNLTAVIPLGPEYKVSPKLSLQLRLVYNSHVWRFEESGSFEQCGDSSPGGTQYTCRYAVPIEEFNAGLGWTLTLGQLVQDKINDKHRRVFIGPDGARHAFTTPASTPTLTTDGSHMRLTTSGSTETVEAADGTIYTFTSGRLTQIADRRANAITIAYSSTTSYSDIWTISAAGAQIKVYRTPNAVHHIEFPTTTGTSTYTFDNVVTEIKRPTGDQYAPTGNIAVTLLRSVTLPQIGTATPPKYDMSWPAGSAPSDEQQCTNPPAPSGLRPAYSICNSGSAGVLLRIALPTRGAIEWGYVADSHGRNEPGRSPALNFPLYVSERVHRGEATTDQPRGNVLGTWTYGRTYSDRETSTANCQLYTDQHPDRSFPRQLTTWVIAPPELKDGVPQPSVASLTYYSVYEEAAEIYCSRREWRTAEYGLPLTHYAMQSNRHARGSPDKYPGTEDGNLLSGEVRVGFTGGGDFPNETRTTVAVDGTLSRSIYTRYESDGGLATQPDDFDQRQSHSTTFFEDDSECGTGGTDPCYSSWTNTEYDGYGHYRRKSTAGNFPGKNFTTSFTNYHTRVASDPWVLNTWSEECAVEDSSFRSASVGDCSTLPATALVTKIKFDREHGEIDDKRVWNSTISGTHPQRTASDTLMHLDYDSRGAVTSEQYFGGSQELGTANDFTAPATPTYEIDYDNTYNTAGALLTRRGRYVKSTAGVKSDVLTTTDETFNASTGLVTAIRDSAGEARSFTYDARWRLATDQPPGEAATSYTYTDASSDAPAKVVAERTSGTSGVLQATYEYDPFGRLIHRKTLMPSGETNFVNTVYDAQGRTVSVSTPFLNGETSLHKTKFTDFDAFGNPGTITAPDGSITTVIRTGARKVERTVNDVAIDDTNKSIKVTETYDAFGHLISVSEPSGPSSAANPRGGAVTTAYGYDVAGHLVSVSMTSPESPAVSQARAFTYDSRGFLVKEKHPELGVNGNAETLYGDHDARGHVHRKTTGATDEAYDLVLGYDEAERLTSVKSGGTSSTAKTLKSFTFATANSTGNYEKGRLETATRLNTLPVGGDIVVTETYKYGISGRVSDRDTTVKQVVSSTETTLQSFTQAFGYDDLGETTSITYPTCVTVTCAGVSGNAPLTDVFTNGRLASVGSFAPALTYNINGTLATVKHGMNGTAEILDTYGEDANGMSRPASVKFSGYDCTAPSTPVITASNGVCPNSTGNTASIPAVSGATYLWTITGGTTSVNNQQQITYTAGGGTSLTLSVSITNACGSASATKTVTISRPTATVSGTQWIAPGGSATIQAALTGTPPFTVTWSDGIQQTNLGCCTASRTVSPSAQTTYSVTSVSDATCGSGTTTGSATISIRIPSPATMSATTQSNPQLSPPSNDTVLITWSAVPNASSYRVERVATLNGTATTITASTTATSMLDNSIGLSDAPVAYIYRVYSCDSGQHPSDLFATDYAATARSLFSNEPLQALVTPILGAHVRELRLAIDAVRVAAGIGPVGWSTQPPTGLITAADNIQMRSALDQAAVMITGHGVTYSGITPASGGGIFAYQYQQIRNGVR
jgi:hypothetical protein